MSKDIKEQFEEIFGKGSFDAGQQSVDDQLDAQMERDLASAIGFDPTPVADAVQELFNALKLTHSQQGLVFTKLLADASNCPVGNVINIKTLEGNLGAALVKTARRAEAPSEPLVESSLMRVLNAAELAEATL